jgi:phosphatidylserine synthase
MMKNSNKQAFIYRNLPNIVSVLGVLPLVILFLDNGFQYLLPLIIFNNIMDDLDGILAKKLDLRSEFGAMLDNVCDAVAHIIFVMTVCIHFGTACTVAGMVASAAILIRVTSRITFLTETSTGSPTNELMRHILLVLLTTTYFNFNPAPFLIAVLLLNSISMHLPYPMHYLLRSLTKSALAIGCVNILLIVAWMFPVTAPVITFSFIATFLYSFISEGVGWIKGKMKISRKKLHPAT